MSDVCSTFPVHIHAINPSTTKPSKRQLMDLTRDLRLLSKFFNPRMVQCIHALYAHTNGVSQLFTTSATSGLIRSVNASPLLIASLIFVPLRKRQKEKLMLLRLNRGILQRFAGQHMENRNLQLQHDLFQL